MAASENGLLQYRSDHADIAAPNLSAGIFPMKVIAQLSVTGQDKARKVHWGADALVKDHTVFMTHNVRRF